MRRPQIVEDPGYWRSRAEEVRTMADSFINPNTKAKLLSIAESYEELAKAAEQPLVKKSSRRP